METRKPLCSLFALEKIKKEAKTKREDQKGQKRKEGTRPCFFLQVKIIMSELAGQPADKLPGRPAKWARKRKKIQNIQTQDPGRFEKKKYKTASSAT